MLQQIQKNGQLAFSETATESESQYFQDSQYIQLLQSLQTPLYTTDLKGKITFYNKAAAALWGREPDVAKDRWCGSIKTYTSDGTPLSLLEGPMAECIRRSTPISGEELVIDRPDGSKR